jgi:hypothetical protein
MNTGIKTVCFVLTLCIAFTIIGCRKEPERAQDIESVRESLSEQVASGELTKEEAIVRLAEAKAKLGSHNRDEKKLSKDEKKLSPELEALSKDLKEQVASGEMSEDDAFAAWMEAAKGTKGESGTESEYSTDKSKHSGKDSK